MKTSKNKKILPTFAGAVLMLVAGVASPGTVLVGEELAVIQAMAAIVSHDASRPLELLYWETEFEGAPFVTVSLENPDRDQFCGLTRPEALKVVQALADVSSIPAKFDKETAKAAGLRLGKRKDPRFPYVVLSRPVFGPENRSAWVAVEVNGTSGGVMRLEKSDGEWKKSSRCGGWIKSED
jgi:hypothetical protein